MAKNPYEATVLLPRTDFPMRGELPRREPEILARWAAEDLYGRIRAARAGRPRFLLHDGPPYANGPIHMGTALNKTLKDIVVRYKTMRGLDAPFVHGWDCHGLPIEHAVVKEDPSLRGRPAEVRRRCRAFAARFVGIQRDAFVRLGCLGDWRRPYLTMDPAYEAAEIEALGALARRGHVYRDLKPIHWCPRCATALAEAEIEYAEKESHSITVAFPSADEPDLDVVIWTTTPWTLPANVAVAVHPDLSYVEVRAGGRRRLVAEALLGATAGDCGWSAPEIVGRRAGRDLEGLTLRHPFLDREVKVILGTFVTTDSGTGCVHIAPGHGQEDYVVGARYGLAILSPVDAEGHFTPEAGVCAGRDVLEANDEIVMILRDRGALLAEGRLRHSYPHCWRCKGPVIFRATPQWFLSVERDGLRARALAAAEGVEWIPAWGKDRFTNMLRERPDWCLSRQRAWGVPIPALRCPCGEAFIDEEVVRRAVDLVRAGGVDAWFEADVAAVAAGVRCPRCGGAEGLRKETDILDVWFDSGLSWYAVVERRLRPPEEGPADLYLEGADQHRGWFQTSIWPSLVLRDRAPYRAVLTHGWMLDGKGAAMHKSAGNAIDPAEVWGRYGADVLRLWVSSEDYREDVRLSPEILDRAADSYRKIRNTWRYLLGNLDGYDPTRDDVSPAASEEIDRWALGRLDTFLRAATEAYEQYAFHRVHRLALELCAVDLSAFYLDVRKDVLYCDPPDSAARRSARSAMYRIASTTMRALAPILPFTSEEAWRHLPGTLESVHLAAWPAEIGAADPNLERRFASLLAQRNEILRALEAARAGGTIKRSEEARVTLAGHEAPDPSLADLCLVAEVLPGGGPGIWVERTAHPRCPRCRRHRPAARDGLCARCAGVLSSPSR